MNPAAKALLVAVTKVGASAGAVILFETIGRFNLLIPAHWTRGELWDVARIVFGAGGAAVGSLWNLGQGRTRGFLLALWLAIFYVMIHLYGRFTDVPPPVNSVLLYDIGAKAMFFFSYFFLGICTGEIITFLYREYLSKKQPVG